MDYALTIIGAGVVGLAIAAELAPRVPSILVLEQYGKFGQETSSRNSEVLHAGLYYAPGSLKARLCVEGNALIQHLAEKHGVPVRMVGKLVVGDDQDEAALDGLFRRAVQSGAQGLRRLSRAEIQTLEPNVSSTQGFFSANTGILDAHGLMRFFLARAEEAGADMVYQARVEGIERLSGGYSLEVKGPDGATSQVSSERVVNAAGLGADRIAAMTGIDVDQVGYRLKFCRGDYFSTSPRCWKLTSHLVYPVPGHHAAGLGIHVTLDLGGRMRLGPDTTWLQPGEPLGYVVDPEKRAGFVAAVRRYLPAITEADLEPEFAGIRPKLQGPGEPARDFVIQEERERGLPGFVNLIGIESPGLTASPAIAREVRRLLEA